MQNISIFKQSTQTEQKKLYKTKIEWWMRFFYIIIQLELNWDRIESHTSPKDIEQSYSIYLHNLMM